MTERIFRSIYLVALGVFLACIALFLGVLYEYFSGVQEKQLAIEAELTAQAVSHEGMDFFENLEPSGYRITWIDADGSVLYDSQSDSSQLENHLAREEIIEAIKTGTGQSYRYSDTLMERALYAAKLLPDGTIVRLSVLNNTILTLLLGMSQPILILIVIALVLSLFFAYRLSKQIVKPLNELNLDRPLDNVQYEEIAPLLRRIDAQQHEIRKQKNQLLQKQNEFEIVTQDMSEGIILVNKKLDVIFMNKAADQLLNTYRKKVGKPAASVIPYEGVSELLEKASLGGQAEMLLDIDNEKYQLTASPVLSKGEVSGLVLLLLNVTQKEYMERLRREFTANVSHELKTPLQMIAGSSELLSEGQVKESDLNAFYSRIHDESLRMIRLVEDTIRLSRLDEGAEEFKLQDVDLLEMVQRVSEALKPSAQKENITISVEGSSSNVQGYPELLQSLVYNLLDNAIKYNRPCGSVSIAIENQDDALVLSVSDTGIGIPVSDQERVFERFYRVDKSRSREIGGTGLGLSIVKHVAKLHNAQIQVQSIPDGGTTISVLFPKNEI